MMAPALFVGPRSDGLAHHSVEMPFSSYLFTSLDYIFEFHQEFDVFLVFFIIPVVSPVSCFFFGIFHTVNHFFGFENPRLDLFEGRLITLNSLGMIRCDLIEENHVVHFDCYFIKIINRGNSARD